MKYLDKIKSPADVKNLNEDDLPLLAQEIREVLVDTVSQNGGHLASVLSSLQLLFTGFLIRPRIKLFGMSAIRHIRISF